MSSKRLQDDLGSMTELDSTSSGNNANAALDHSSAAFGFGALAIQIWTLSLVSRQTRKRGFGMPVNRVAEGRSPAESLSLAGLEGHSGRDQLANLIQLLGVA